MALESRTETGQREPERACEQQAPVNLIDAPLVTVTNRAKALAFRAFSATSKAALTSQGQSFCTLMINYCV